jgi:hypothetical protein
LTSTCLACTRALTCASVSEGTRGVGWWWTIAWQRTAHLGCTLRRLVALELLDQRSDHLHPNTHPLGSCVVTRRVRVSSFFAPLLPY